jgi:hypothetical protein
MAPLSQNNSHVIGTDARPNWQVTGHQPLRLQPKLCVTYGPICHSKP